MIEATPESAGLGDQVVLITGAARRVGADIARTLHGAGARVMIHYHRSAAQAEALAATLNSLRPNSAGTCRADVLDLHELESLVRMTLDQFSRLDVLINNASTFYPTRFGEINLREWDDLFGSNLRAPVFLTQAAAPHLRKAQGSVINIVDIHALRPLKHHLVYGMAKAGLVMATRALARELGPHVRVNGIAPGPVLWPENGISDELKQEIIGKTALKRAGSAQDIARTALFLIRDAPYITGQIIAVDGGRSI